MRPVVTRPNPSRSFDSAALRMTGFEVNSTQNETRLHLYHGQPQPLASFRRVAHPCLFFPGKRLRAPNVVLGTGRVYATRDLLHPFPVQPVRCIPPDDRAAVTVFA